MDQTVVIAEIFKSIQGESTWAGLPCVFVRLAGCTVGCSYCDTAYARDGGETMTIGEVVNRCTALACPLVEITGGEPLEQAACPALAQALLDAGCTVLCETSGTVPIDVLPAGVIRIMDIKCPGSGASGKNRWENIETLSARDEVKFVIGSREDYEWSRDIVQRHELTERCHAVLFSPVWGRIEPHVLAEWVATESLGVRYQIQLHKVLWPAEERGV